MNAAGQQESAGATLANLLRRTRPGLKAFVAFSLLLAFNLLVPSVPAIVASRHFVSSAVPERALSSLDFALPNYLTACIIGLHLVQLSLVWFWIRLNICSMVNRLCADVALSHMLIFSILLGRMFSFPNSQLEREGALTGGIILVYAYFVQSAFLTYLVQACNFDISFAKPTAKDNLTWKYLFGWIAISTVLIPELLMGGYFLLMFIALLGSKFLWILVLVLQFYLVGGLFVTVNFGIAQRLLKLRYLFPACLLPVLAPYLFLWTVAGVDVPLIAQEGLIVQLVSWSFAVGTALIYLLPPHCCAQFHAPEANPS